MRQTTIATVLLFLIALISGCGGCSSKHGSPEAAFEAMQDAAQEEDWETAVEQMTDHSQKVLARVMLSALDKAGPENKDEVESLLKRHRRASDETAPKMDVESIKDKPAFLAEAIALLKKLGEEGSPTFGSPSDTLEELKIDGNSATAVIVTDTFRTPIEFRHVDGGWLLHISHAPRPRRPPATRTALDVLR